MTARYLQRDELCAMLGEAPQTFANSTRKIIPPEYVVKAGRSVLFRSAGILVAVTFSKLQLKRDEKARSLHETSWLAGRSSALAVVDGVIEEMGEKATPEEAADLLNLAAAIHTRALATSPSLSRGAGDGANC